MSPEERCHVCDRPDGWASPPHDVDGGCECPECCALCWGGPQCASGSVDWRARALAAERDLALSLGAGWQAAARDKIATLEARLAKARDALEAWQRPGPSMSEPGGVEAARASCDALAALRAALESLPGGSP